MANPDISVSVDEILAHFEDLEDPRSTINLMHPLPSVILIAVLAVLAGAGGPTAIALWAMNNAEKLAMALHLPNGIPRKDVFRRVLATLKPMAFQLCFTAWLSDLRRRASEQSPIDQPVMSVDGKTLRRTHDKKNGLGPLHSVSIWMSEYGISLGQVATPSKSNEITAIPTLLELVDISGGIITIDAMGTQVAIAEKIIENDADYVLNLKGNQETLYNAVVEHINQEQENGFSSPGVERFEKTETRHGRKETREYVQIPLPEGLAGAERWPKLKSIGMAKLTSLRDGKETSEIRYYICSLEVDVKRFGRSVRSHWGIENGCHYVLDMTFREDELRIRNKQLRFNFACLNRIALSLLKQKQDKHSVAMRRRICGWNFNYLTQVLTGVES